MVGGQYSILQTHTVGSSQSMHKRDSDILHAFADQHTVLPSQTSNINKFVTSGSIYITNDTLVAIAECLANLQSLILNSYGDLCDTNLQSLSYNADGIHYVLTHCPKMTELAISPLQFASFTDNDYASLIPYCVNLMRLRIDSGLDLSTSTSLRIIKECPKLQILSLVSCEKVDIVKLKVFIRAHPQHHLISLEDDNSDEWFVTLQDIKDHGIDPFSITVNGECYISTDNKNDINNRYNGSNMVITVTLVVMHRL
jgi:hypothetical protein